jgi:hypothetical protein
LTEAGARSVVNSYAELRAHLARGDVPGDSQSAAPAPISAG